VSLAPEVLTVKTITASARHSAKAGIQSDKLVPNRGGPVALEWNMPKLKIKRATTCRRQWAR